MDDFESTKDAAEPVPDATVADLIEKYNTLFDDMTAERHEVGREKYGDFTFLENDVIRMLMEELADASNYARYMFIKLGILNEYVQNELQNKSTAPGHDEKGNITIGVASFKGTKEGWGQ